MKMVKLLLGPIIFFPAGTIIMLFCLAELVQQHHHSHKVSVSQHDFYLMSKLKAACFEQADNVMGIFNFDFKQMLF